MSLSLHFLPAFVPLFLVGQIKLHPELTKICKNHKTLVSCNWGISVLPYFTFVKIIFCLSLKTGCNDN